jgi:hypothetical protein
MHNLHGGGISCNSILLIAFIGLLLFQFFLFGGLYFVILKLRDYFDHFIKYHPIMESPIVKMLLGKSGSSGDSLNPLAMLTGINPSDPSSIAKLLGDKNLDLSKLDKNLIPAEYTKILNGEQNNILMSQQHNNSMNQQNNNSMNQQNNNNLMSQQNDYLMSQQNDYLMSQQNDYLMSQQNDYLMSQEYDKLMSLEYNKGI